MHSTKVLHFLLHTTVTDNLQLPATFPPSVARNASGGVPLPATSLPVARNASGGVPLPAATPSIARNANGGPLSACHPLHRSKHKQRGPSACHHPLCCAVPIYPLPLPAKTRTCCSQVQVLTGMGMGQEYLPKGYPCRSLLIVLQHYIH